MEEDISFKFVLAWYATRNKFIRKKQVYMKETVCSVDLTIKHISQCTLFKSKQCTEVLFFLLRIFLQRKLFFQSTSFERSDSYLFGTEDQDLSKK